MLLGVDNFPKLRYSTIILKGYYPDFNQFTIDF